MFILIFQDPEITLINLDDSAADEEMADEAKTSNNDLTATSEKESHSSSNTNNNDKEDMVKIPSSTPKQVSG